MTRLTLALALLASMPAAAAPQGAHAVRDAQAASAAVPEAGGLVTVCGKDAQGNYIPGALVYGSGPLIQHVKVFDVFYNTGNQYKDMLTAYYTAITQSAYMDWLTEYNKGGYTINRGSFLGVYEDTNSATTSKTLSDSQIQTYLSGLIDNKKVPAPDDDTMYMIYFPTPITISMGGSQSCASGGFCAYHGSYTHLSKKVRYGVMPDQAAGGCATGCGPGNAFQNTTDVSSHELIEAITDPDNGTGWYDNNCGEIGDICAIGTGESAVVNNFTVQKEWSNKNNNCIATDPNVVVNDFTIAATPSTVNVPAGGMATVMLVLTKTSGAAENVTLSVPTPVTAFPASFAPASISSAGGTSTMTISAAATATVGSTGKITVKAAGMTVQPTIDINVTVVDAPDMAQPQGGGSGGTGGGGSGGNGNNGGNGGSGGGGSSGCSMSGGDIAGAWAIAALVLLALAFRRRRA